MKNAEVLYFKNFFTQNESNAYFDSLLKNINWQQDYITVFGKTHLQPRLTAFYATNSKTYSYSNIIMTPNPFDGAILEIKKTIENQLKTEFTSCLANLYRSGQDSNGWHADDEKELGKNPTIASVTFGEERIFHFKHKYDASKKLKLTLHHGSLLLMKGETQHFWLHQIPKTKKQVTPRINLTFRIIA
ncbi:alpha-ketoglutarate-dependent dioxygenase AlkB family protein [Siansivirga zeaxanthinifaciens]|nr:alpha-ketoglutarate-dependent dioxygenase AlkB [Siansivirga zeaxanthinifaciens]